MLPYEVDSPGYIEFPGTTGNYLSVPDDPTLDITPDLCVVAKIAPDDWTPGSSAGVIVAKNVPVDGQRSWVWMLGTSGALSFSFSGNGTTAGSATAISAVLGFEDGSAEWIAVTLDGGGAGEAVVRFWKSPDNVTWTLITQVATGITISSLFNTTAPLTIGAHNNGLSECFKGKIYDLSVRNGIGTNGEVGGTEVFRFDASTDLAGVPWSGTSLKPSVGPVVTLNRKVSAADQGYIHLPGTVGNYMDTPDVANLDITGAITFVFRARVTDQTPVKLGMGLLSKATPTTQLSYWITLTPRATRCMSVLTAMVRTGCGLLIPGHWRTTPGYGTALPSTSFQPVGQFATGTRRSTR